MESHSDIEKEIIKILKGTRGKTENTLPEKLIKHLFKKYKSGETAGIEHFITILWPNSQKTPRNSRKFLLKIRNQINHHINENPLQFSVYICRKKESLYLLFDHEKIFTQKKKDIERSRKPGLSVPWKKESLIKELEDSYNKFVLKKPLYDYLKFFIKNIKFWRNRYSRHINFFDEFYIPINVVDKSEFLKRQSVE